MCFKSYYFLPFRSSFVQPASSKSPPHSRQNRDPPSLHLLHLAAILLTSVGLCSTTKTDRSLIAKQLLIKLHIENCSFKWSLLSHCYFATQNVTLFTTMPHKLLGQRCQQFLSVISIQVQQGIYLLGAQALRGDTQACRASAYAQAALLSNYRCLLPLLTTQNKTSFVVLSKTFSH